MRWRTTGAPSAETLRLQGFFANLHLCFRLRGKEDKDCSAQFCVSLSCPRKLTDKLPRFYRGLAGSNPAEGANHFNAAAKNPVRPSEGAAEGGCGGNSAAPERNQKEASPAALLVQSRTQQKSFLFLLEEKIRRAQIRKSEENFFAGWRALASGGGAASLVPFKVGSREVYNYSTKTNFVGIDLSVGGRQVV